MVIAVMMVVKYYIAMIKQTSEMFCMTNMSWTVVNVQHSLCNHGMLFGIFRDYHITNYSN
jgi:hypothetical protein